MRPHSTPDSIAGLAVVVPARNEAALIRDCLHSIERARKQLAERLPVVTVVVDDSSTDETAELARAFSGVFVAHSPGGNVGRARATGVEHALAQLALDPRHVWIANTDADSTVPENWLTEQLRIAESGADVLIGTVRPTLSELTADQVDAWLTLNEPGVARGDVHGANLGVRGSAYLAAGGFGPLAEHEDVDLVARLRTTPKPDASALPHEGTHPRLVSSAAAEVVTSGRLWGRTPGGFAGYLRTQLVPRQSVVR